MSLSNEAISRILEVNDYRSFILTYKKEKSIKSSFSYSQIAQRAGFSSSSFPRDVAVGQKRLTVSSLYLMIKGLGLTGDLADYFKMLVNSEHADTIIDGKKILEIERTKQNLKDRIRKKKNLSFESDPYKYEFFPIIYAACGNEATGATIDEIQNKTNLPTLEIENTLNALIGFKLINKKQTRYIPYNSHLFFEAIDESTAFKKFFNYLLIQASVKSKKDFKSQENLFFASSFSVKKSQQENLKKDLRTLLLSYIDKAEQADGDKINSIICSMF